MEIMTQSEMRHGQRNSKMLLDEVYFWTDTIKDWHKLLDDDFNKNVSPDQVILYKEYSDDERNHRFWQRDPLAVLMDSKNEVEQKVNYIHLNPLQEQWNLVTKPEDYRWSSAKFYETGVDEFNILTDYRDRF